MNRHKFKSGLWVASMEKQGNLELSIADLGNVALAGRPVDKSKMGEHNRSN
jgi:hypothetical protein